MWREFSREFIRKNRASSISVIAAAFLSALFLSLLCSLFFNFWRYEIEQITLDEGGWQARITGEFGREALSVIEQFANVEKAEINEELSEGSVLAVDLCFQNMRTVYEETPLIAQRLGIDGSGITYHETLLSRYLIHDPQDSSPPLLLSFYLAVLLIVSVSFVLIIHNSFALSMNARVHQFGILSGAGATPGQIRACLMQEAAALSLIPVLAGSLLGIALSFGTIQLINRLAASIPGRHQAVFAYHPLLLAVTLLAAFLTVFFSALLPALRLGRLTPLEAIQGSGEFRLKKKKRSRVLSLLFGMEGELAGNALKAQKKALRTSTLSLTLSFLGFTLMLCFFTLSGISTNHTYFERYQDAWDIMAEVKDTDLDHFAPTEEVLALQGADTVLYQKAEALCSVPESAVSREVTALGGLEAVAQSAVSKDGTDYLIQAPVVILDDRSFAKYCEQTGIEADMSGTIVLNRIWDSVNSNFRYKSYVPFLLEDQDTLTLRNPAEPDSSAAVPVLAYTAEPPVLREEYANYALIQFLPLSLWRQISPAIGNAKPNVFIRVLTEEEATLSDLNTLGTELAALIGPEYAVEMENRIQERLDNDRMLRGYMLIIGAFCALLALIGIANVFSNTLGFVRQRKREFARYLSVGMTPAGMRKMFFVEALVIAGRPALITLPLTALFAGFMIQASYLDPAEFLAKAPVVPVAVFLLAIFGFVALAYYLGGKKLLKCSLAEALRSDFMI